MRFMIPIAIAAGICSAEAAEPYQLESSGDLAAMRAILPRVADPHIQAILEDPRLMLYTTDSIGVIYQIGAGQSTSGAVRIGDAGRNISGEAPEQGRRGGTAGNPNTSRHFPWSIDAGGTHVSPSADSFKGVWLPARPDGTPWPVVWYRHAIESVFDGPGRTQNGFNWTFPAGTVFVECLTVRAPSGQVYPFELRVRERDLAAWRPAVYRPFPQAGDLAEAIQRERPGWRESIQLAALVDHLDDPAAGLREIRVRDRSPGNRRFGTGPSAAFDLTVSIDDLPEAGDEDLIAYLLDTETFRDAEGLDWKASSAVPSFLVDMVISRPAGWKNTLAAAPLHIRPAGDLSAITGSDSESCTRCHDTTLASARRFDARSGMYGWVRGNLGDPARGGGIFSWHPFRNVTGITRTRFSIRAEFRDNGLVARFQPDRHPSTVYRALIPEHLRGKK